LNLENDYYMIVKMPERNIPISYKRAGIYKEVYMRHLMSPLDFSVEELDKLLDLANDIEKFPGKYVMAKSLQHVFMSQVHEQDLVLKLPC
jgi:hypothetical protein